MGSNLYKIRKKNTKNTTQKQFSNIPTLSIFDSQATHQFFFNLQTKLRYIFKNITICRYISKYILLVNKSLFLRIEVGVAAYLLSGREI